MKLGRYNKLLTLITLSIALLNFSYSQEDGLNSAPSDPSDQTLPVAGFQPEQEVFMSKNQEKFEFQVSVLTIRCQLESSFINHFLTASKPIPLN
jgi:hypothetical protein